VVVVVPVAAAVAAQAARQARAGMVVWMRPRARTRRLVADLALRGRATTEEVVGLCECRHQTSSSMVTGGTTPDSLVELLVSLLAAGFPHSHKLHSECFLFCFCAQPAQSCVAPSEYALCTFQIKGT
jgi:hypothetical protein